MMIKKIFSALASLQTALWLTGLLVAMLAAGALVMPASERFQSIHDLPLLRWMQQQPFEATWWLWGAIVILVALTINTLLCSIDSVRRKRTATRWLLLISPQLIHIGFLLMLLAHLASATGGYKKLVVAGEGTVLELPGTTAVRVTNIDLSIDATGYLRDWSVGIEYFSAGGRLHADTVRPNSPSFHTSMGIYVKDLRAYPEKLVLLEAAREPGAPWALAGGILFTAGTLTLLALRMRREAGTG